MLLKQEGLKTSFCNMFLNVLVRLSEWEGNHQKKIEIYRLRCEWESHLLMVDFPYALLPEGNILWFLVFLCLTDIKVWLTPNFPAGKSLNTEGIQS